MKKLVLDFLPIIIFFIIYKNTGDIITATVVLIPATLLQVGYVWWTKGKIEMIYLITLALVVLLGGATIIFQDSTFIKLKPTVVNWIFAGVFLGSELWASKNLLEHMSGHQIQVPKSIWTRLNYAWIMYFMAIGVVNLYVAFSGQFSEEAWVNFKLFGMLGLTFVFMIFHSIYLVRHMESPIKETVPIDDGEQKEN